MQTNYQIADLWYECQEVEWHRNGWEKFEPIERRVCQIDFIIIYILHFFATKWIKISSIFLLEKRNYRVLIVSPKRVKENGKWCFLKKGKQNISNQRTTVNKMIIVFFRFSFNAVKKSNRLQNMHFQMRMMNKKIRWTFKPSNQLMVRHLRHISPSHIQHQNMKRPNKLCNIHHQLVHQFSINLVNSLLKKNKSLIFKFDTFSLQNWKSHL